MKKLKKEIATFLHLERIEYFKGTDKIFEEYFWEHSDRYWNDDSDTESQASVEVQEDSEFYYGRNLKIISGSS